MQRAQGSLEYLVLIAVALAVVSVVIAITINYLDSQQGHYSFNSCKNAAANCKVAIVANPNDKCSYCDTDCKKSDGTDISTKASTCCKLGIPGGIYEGATGAECTGCLDPSECDGNPCCAGTCCAVAGGTCCGSACCSSSQVCESGTCVTPACTVATQATDCAYLNPAYCERVRCDGTGSSAKCVKEANPSLAGQLCPPNYAYGQYQCTTIKKRCRDITTYTCSAGACVGQLNPLGNCLTCDVCQQCIDQPTGDDTCGIPSSLGCAEWDEGLSCGYAGDNCRCCIPLGRPASDISCMQGACPV